MALLIRIERSTVKFIAELNDGVEPLVEDPPSMFLFYGKDRPNEIISLKDAIFRFMNDPNVRPRVIEYCIFQELTEDGG